MINDMRIRLTGNKLSFEILKDGVWKTIPIVSGKDNQIEEIIFTPDYVEGEKLVYPKLPITRDLFC